MLLEKAWAKLHGSYCMIRAGSPSMVFPHLTGAPTLRVDHNILRDTNRFWDEIKDSDKRHHMITACSYERDTLQTVDSEKKMIVSSHVYAVISVHEITRKGEKVKLLKLRNPHGQHEWTGDWSDRSELWDEKTRSELGMEAADDGVFFIDFENYIKHFRTTSICFDAGEETPPYRTTTLDHDFGEADE